MKVIQLPGKRELPPDSVHCFEPLVVIAHVPAAMILYDPLYLDNLLAWAVVQRVTNGQGLPDTSDAYDIPLPLATLWTSEGGLPLWVSSCFLPLEEMLTGTTYYHRRSERNRNSGARSGRFRDRRLPMPTVYSRQWGARCVGDRAAIAELLRGVTSLGKRRTGIVTHWEIKAGDFSPEEVFISDGALTHAIPKGAEVALKVSLEGDPVLVGWTPPQWKPSLFLPGWAIKTLVNRFELDEDVDFFEAVENL